MMFMKSMKIKSIFLSIFGDTPVLRVLVFLIIHEDFDYSMKDIAKFSGVGYSTLKLFWPKLEKEKIVKQTRTVGKAKMFKLNLSKPIVKTFKNFYWDITKQKVHEAFHKKTVTMPLTA